MKTKTNKPWNMLVRLLKRVSITLIVLIIVIVMIVFVKYREKLAKYPRFVDTPATRVMPHDQRVVLFALGDSGSGSVSQRDVARAMEERCKKQEPDALLLLGDLIYPDGTQTLQHPHWNERIFDMYGSECLAGLPIFPALGNHDYNGDPRIWTQAGEINARWWFPHRHYEALFEDLLALYVIDTTNPLFIHTALPALEQRSTPWSIAYGHHPLNSASASGGRHRGGGLGGMIVRRAICDHVDTFLSGHSHHLEHIDIDNCQADQFISGAGGAVLYPLRENPQHHFGAVTYGFLEIEARPQTIAFRFISTDQSVLYEHHKRKPEIAPEQIPRP